MERYFLVDFENVRSEGLYGCEKFEKEDHIVIFFTGNANKIDMRAIANCGKADLTMKEVPSGKQSCDMHIAAYMGYLAGIYGEKEHGIVIVSKDRDFDNVLDFWKAENRSYLRIPSIDALGQKSDKQPKTGNIPPEKALKQNINNETMKLLSSAGFESETIGYVTSIVSANVGKKDWKQIIYRTIISKFGQKRGLAIYNTIKKYLSSYH